MQEKIDFFYMFRLEDFSKVQRVLLLLSDPKVNKGVMFISIN
jgi:hypothetical protein